MQWVLLHTDSCNCYVSRRQNCFLFVWIAKAPAIAPALILAEVLSQQWHSRGEKVLFSCSCFSWVLADSIGVSRWKSRNGGKYRWSGGNVEMIDSISKKHTPFSFWQFRSVNHTELSWVMSLSCKSRILNSLVEFVSSLTVTTHIRFHSMVVLFATTFDTILVVCLLAVWTQIHVHCTITVVSWQTRCALLLKLRFLLASFPLIVFLLFHNLCHWHLYYL